MSCDFKSNSSLYTQKRSSHNRLSKNNFLFKVTGDFGKKQMFSAKNKFLAKKLTSLKKLDSTPLERQSFLACYYIKDIV